MRNAPEGCVQAHYANGVATMAADPHFTLLTANDIFYTLLALPAGLAPGAALRPVLPAGLLAFLDEALRSSTPEEQAGELFQRSADGEILRLHATVMPLPLLANCPSAPCRSFRLVLSRIAAAPDNVLLHLSPQHYATLTDVAEDISFVYDLATDTARFAERYADVFGSGPVFTAFRSLVLTLPPDSGDIRACFREVFADQAALPEKMTREYLAHTRAEGPRWYALRCAVADDAEGRPVRLVGVLRDIHDHKTEQQTLLDRARTDAMTGLLNKQTTEEEVKAALLEARPGGRGVLMMLDIDNFKLVNDTMGHLAGDSVLVQVAAQLGRVFRKNDIIGRMGGDEFHIYMRDVADSSLIHEKADLLCETIRALFVNSNLGHDISISLGISSTEAPMDYEELFSEADIALYRAKTNGKNRYEIFGEMRREPGAKGQPMSPLTVNAVRNSIMVDIIDILFSMCDIQEGIDKVLHFIGNALSVDKILIFEKSFDLSTISITHEWLAEGAHSSKVQCRNVPVAAMSLPKASDPSGIFYCTDTSALTPEERNYLFDDDVTSLLQCAITREGREVGYISFAECGHKRIWTQQEVDALILMAKLIGEYIRQNQSTLLLRQSYEMTRNVLNNLPGTLVYVIRRDDHRIVYFNDTVARRFPGIHTGMPCHEAFWGNVLPCGFCPARQAPQNGSVSSILYNTPFGKEIDISLSPMLWENTIPSYVVLLSAHVLNLEEQTQKKKQEAFSQALSASYDNVLDIDPESGRYEMLSSPDSSSAPWPPAGDYVAHLKFIGENHIEPPFREALLRLFQLEALKQSFAKGEESVEMDFQRRCGGEIRWKRRRAFPARLEDGSFRIISYNCDITAQKEAEYRRKRDETHYWRALRSSYAEICEVNPDTDSVRPIYRDSSLLALPDMTSGYADAVRRIAEQYVHPGDRDAFLRERAPSAIAACCDRREETCLEYRSIGLGGRYRWISSRVLPLLDEREKDGGQERTALILCRDVTTEKELAESSRQMERRFDALFRQSCDVVTEINLDTWEYVQTEFTHTCALDVPSRGDYRAAFQNLLDHSILAEDAPALREAFSPEAFKRAREAHTGEIVCQYRLPSASGLYEWLEGQAFFMPDSNAPTLVILIRNITERKRREEMSLLAEQRYNRALRDTYTEIYELDLDLDRPTLLYTKSPVLIPVDTDKKADIHDIAGTLIHPDDSGHFINSFLGTNLRRRFSAGCDEVAEEHRRLGTDGRYYWVSASMVPLCLDERGNGKKAMLLVRDITERKRDEQQKRVTEQYDRALRNIYDELYEINVPENKYRIIYHVIGKYVTPPDQGVLSETIVHISEHMIYPPDKDNFLRFFDLDAIRAEFATGLEYRVGEFRKLWYDGRYHWTALTMFPLRIHQGGEEMYLVFVMDIEPRKNAEAIARKNALLEQQQLADERYRTIVELTDTLVFEWYADSGEHYAAPELVCRFAGDYDHRNVLTVWLDDHVVHDEDADALRALLADAGKREGCTETTVRLRLRDGKFIWSKIALSALRGKDQAIKRFIGTLNDVDDATRSIRALQYRAEFDTLTGVYNAPTFYANAAAHIQRYPQRRHSIIRMDVLRFKVINELYGLQAGDLLLRAIAGLLTENLGTRAVYGRIGGDIFCICVDYDDEETVRRIQSVSRQLENYPLPYQVAVSFGICKVDSIGTPINVLCDWANLALQTVKGNYLKNYAFYDESLREKILEEKKIENEMHAALLSEQFVMYLQPKVDIATSRIIGAEALVRWHHPTDGLIQPDRFIPQFEKNGFIARLDEYMWEQACMTLRQWLDKGLAPCPISVNVSRVHFRGRGLCETLPAMVEKYDIPPYLLELELTETAFLENEHDIGGIMRALQQRGFRFTMDDFGSGYSSLTMLKTLPIDNIKIDREFLNEGVATEQGRIVIRHTIAMAQEMKLNVVAEGVENLEQAVFLLRAGCRWAQGYFYSPPVNREQFDFLAFAEPQPPFPVTSAVRKTLEDLRAEEKALPSRKPPLSRK